MFLPNCGILAIKKLLTVGKFSPTRYPLLFLTLRAFLHRRALLAKFMVFAKYDTYPEKTKVQVNVHPFCVYSCPRSITTTAFRVYIHDTFVDRFVFMSPRRTAVQSA